MRVCERKLSKNYQKLVFTNIIFLEDQWTTKRIW